MTTVYRKNTTDIPNKILKLEKDKVFYIGNYSGAYRWTENGDTVFPNGSLLSVEKPIQKSSQFLWFKPYIYYEYPMRKIIARYSFKSNYIDLVIYDESKELFLVDFFSKFEYGHINLEIINKEIYEIRESDCLGGHIIWDSTKEPSLGSYPRGNM